MSEPDIPRRHEETRDDPHTPPSEFDDPINYRDLNDRLPNEALRDELANMTPEEEEEFLRRLEELSKQYLGPGGP
jgi:hypothetical protein